MPSGVYKRPLRLCSVEGCNEKYFAKGLCKNHYFEQYNQDNKERLFEYRKQYQQKNKKRIAKLKKQYYQDNKEYFKKTNKQWKLKNKKHHSEQRKKYGQDNKDKISKYQKKYRKYYYNTTNGKAIRGASRHNRRAIAKSLTKEIIQRVYEDNIKKYGVLTCYLCGKPITKNDDSLDHSTPLARKGSNNYGNLGVAHIICNCRKNTKTLEEWQVFKNGITYQKIGRGL